MKIKILTVKDVSEMLKFSKSTIYAWAESGRIPAIYLNGSWRFKLESIEQWILENSREGSTSLDGEYIPKRKVGSRGVEKNNVNAIVGEAIDSVRTSAYTRN